MGFKSRLDELEDLHDHGAILITEMVELWVRRHPAFYALVAVCVTAVLVL